MVIPIIIAGAGLDIALVDLRELSDFLEQQEAGKGSEGERLLQRLTS